MNSAMPQSENTVQKLASLSCPSAPRQLHTTSPVKKRGIETFLKFTCHCALDHPLAQNRNSLRVKLIQILENVQISVCQMYRKKEH